MKEKGKRRRLPMLTTLSVALFAAVLWRQYPALVRRIKTERV